MFWARTELGMSSYLAKLLVLPRYVIYAIYVYAFNAEDILRGYYR